MCIKKRLIIMIDKVLSQILLSIRKRIEREPNNQIELTMQSSEINYNRIKHSAQGAARTVFIVVWNRDHFPVDPVYIAKKLGAQVVVARLPDEVYGALMKEKGSDPIIYLEETDSEQRQRFTCAHELGHLYSRIGDEEYETIDLRDEWLSPSATNVEEIFANQFAANLLMPEDEIRAQVHHSKAKLLSHFGVSGEAMKWRLKNLDISHPEFMDK